MNIKHLLAIGVLALVLNGCAASRGQQLSESGIEQIRTGVTTEAQIREMFGEPTSVSVDSRTHLKVLTYSHSNEDHKSQLGSVAGAVVGGVVGHQIGNGSGQFLATTLGTLGGGILGGMAPDDRSYEQVLKVIVDTRTGLVADYNYEQLQQKKSGASFNTGVDKF